MFDNEGFEKYLNDLGLKKITITNHLKNLVKWSNYLDEKEINQENFVNVLDTIDMTNSQRLTLSTTASKYLKYSDLPNKKILEYMNNVNQNLKKNFKERNKTAKYEYNLRDLKKEMNKFYNEGNKLAYIITYIVINYNTRNMDLDLYISDKQKNCPNKKDNYLIIRKNDILYIRNKYKTSETYGQKKHQIKNKKFTESVKSIYNDQEEKCMKLFKSFLNPTKFLKKLLPYNLKTSDICKIHLNENNSLKDAVELSQKRGTNVNTLNTNYNLKV